MTMKRRTWARAVRDAAQSRPIFLANYILNLFRRKHKRKPERFSHASFSDLPLFWQGYLTQMNEDYAEAEKFFASEVERLKAEAATLRALADRKEGDA